MTALKLKKADQIELKSLATFGENGTHWPKKDAEKFHKLGATDLGAEAEDGTVQIRVSTAGLQYLQELEKNNVDSGSNSADNGDQSGKGAEANKPQGSKPMFQINSNVEIPKTVRRTRTSAFPFDQLEIGQSFFVPATEARPDPAKSLASTVNGANERHSEVIEGQTKTNRKGNVVAATRPLRKFIVRPVTDGAAWGEEFQGVAGAGVWRVALDD